MPWGLPVSFFDQSIKHAHAPSGVPYRAGGQSCADWGVPVINRRTQQGDRADDLGGEGNGDGTPRRCRDAPSEPHIGAASNGSTDVGKWGETPVELGIGSGDWYEPLFSYTLNNGTPEATGLVLVPPHYEKQKRSGSCWKPPEGDYWGGSGAPEMTTLQPVESFHNDYEVWTDLDVSGCLPPGEYDFGQFREGVTPTWRVSLSVRQ